MPKIAPLDIDHHICAGNGLDPPIEQEVGIGATVEETKEGEMGSTVSVRRITIVTVCVDETSLPPSVVPVETVLPSNWWLHKVLRTNPRIVKWLVVVGGLYALFITATPYDDANWALLLTATTLFYLVVVYFYTANVHILVPLSGNFLFLYMCVQICIAWALDGIGYPLFGGTFNVTIHSLVIVLDSIVFCISNTIMDVCQSMSRWMKLMLFCLALFGFLYFRYQDSPLYGRSFYSISASSSVMGNDTSFCTIYYSCAEMGSVRGSLWGSLAVLSGKNLIFALLYPNSFVLITGRLIVRIHKTMIPVDWDDTNIDTFTPHSKASQLAPTGHNIGIGERLRLAQAMARINSPRGTVFSGVRSLRTFPVFYEQSYESKMLLDLRWFWKKIGMGKIGAIIMTVVVILMNISLLACSVVYDNNLWVNLLSIPTTIFGTLPVISSMERKLLSVLIRKFEMWYVAIPIGGIWIILAMYQTGTSTEDPISTVIRMFLRGFQLVYIVMLTLGDAVPSVNSRYKSIQYAIFAAFFVFARLVLEYYPDILQPVEICTGYYNCMKPVDVAKNLTSPVILFGLKFACSSFRYPDSPVILRTRIEWHHW